MRIFLIWANKGPEMKNLMLNLKKHGHEVVYWVGSTGGDKDKLPETIFHDHLRAVAGLPAKGVDITEFPPPGEDLINQLYKTESLILTMMNKRYDKMCVDERRHLYYNMLQYWQGVIEKYKPEAIIFPAIPHTNFNYLIYELARFSNIKTIIIETTWVSDRVLLYADFWQGSNKLQQELENNKNKNFSLMDLSSDLQEYYKKHISGNCNMAPAYMREIKKKYSIANRMVFLRVKALITSFKDLTFFEKFLAFLLRMFKENIKKEYVSLQAKPDFSKKFIYLPLNYQPERTTSPQGDMFVDQILMIKTLAVALPDNWVIYVKEHPFQFLARGLDFFSSRYQGYYKKIAKLKNVKLVPVKTNTYILINKSQAVATVTGTAGWEAVLRSKPVVIFGYPWYWDCPGVFKVNSVESCKKALKQIRDGFKVKQQQIINYLYSFDKATIHGYCGGDIEKYFKLTKQESMDNITQAILAEMVKT